MSTSFSTRHIGPQAEERQKMLSALNLSSLDELVEASVPKVIRSTAKPIFPEPLSEAQAADRLRSMMAKNTGEKSYLGQGYWNAVVPAVIQRNIFENPGWYTQYTPYQAEIAQGRLEALINFQTLVSDLTGLEIANASLLDEGTAAAEAMGLFAGLHPDKKKIWVSKTCFAQTIEVIRTRAEPLGISVDVRDPATESPTSEYCGAILQYPDALGTVSDWTSWIGRAKDAGVSVALATDLLALTLLKSPGEMGAEIAFGSAQRFGVPVGFGGPHAAFFAVKSEHTRRIPGRIIGVSKDARGRPGYRLSLQTREQHIRRDKATSNICTAQVLLAIMASMYAVYHGPEGLRKIAKRISDFTHSLALAAGEAGLKLYGGCHFDTLQIEGSSVQIQGILLRAKQERINLLRISDSMIGLTLDETVDEREFQRISSVVTGSEKQVRIQPADFGKLERKSEILTHPVFRTYRSETEMQRYMRRLESRDLSLTHSMIPLGSCTMKLNAASEMYPVSWASVSNPHPYSPSEQVSGYLEMCRELEHWLCAITGFDAVSLQPNAGSQGEYTGLLVIRAYHRSRGDDQREICLIPKSAHGTNPASAAMAGMKITVVECDSNGNVDVEDLRTKAKAAGKKLAALMITYPSTHGVFETAIREICEVIHSEGGQVYMDGANMNALVGLCRPGEFGPDVCHLNLHKTFCIPHGGGGPGMGPIGVKKQLAPFLPSHPLVKTGGAQAIGPVSSAPFGSASILPISWMYIQMMGYAGLKEATEIAILNANYVAKKLAPHYPVLYSGSGGWVAHECILDLRPLKERSGIEVEDIAKRLMDYGFHAPTISFPVAGTLMIEPTESENLAELDRFVDAMISIRGEIEKVATGKWDRKLNPLKVAPHTAEMVTSSEWTLPYTREEAAWPRAWVRERKFWPASARIDNVYGDRNLICSCPPLESYSEA